MTLPYRVDPATDYEYAYVTADSIGTVSGGGHVTRNESEALAGMGRTLMVDRSVLAPKWYKASQGPWPFDEKARNIAGTNHPFKLVHFYAWTFSDTIRELQARGTKVSYTAAAHRVEDSKLAHEELGLPYNYPHLTEPDQWKKYLQGYIDADLMICPSTHSANVKREYGRTKPIVVIPHGCTPPVFTSPLPRGEFRVGYMGAYGPDKGVRYLLEAWRKLNYKDAVLVLAGLDSQGPWVDHLVKTFGGGRIERRGWVNRIDQFYDHIHCYVQPSCSEGFGIEVLEAMAHARPAICSIGAGACDIVPESYRYEPRDVDELASKIDLMRGVLTQSGTQEWLHQWVRIARQYSWSNICERYVQAWKELLHG